MSIEHAPHLLRFPAVSARYGGRSRAQIWRDVKAGNFPAPVRIGPNSNAWWSNELDAYDATLERVSYAPKTD